jgi:hypothetical protein
MQLICEYAAGVVQIQSGINTTTQQKGAVQFEPPPNGCSFQDAVANFSAGKMHAHPRSHRKK